MAEVFRIDVTKQNCWMCESFRRNNADGADPNRGSCVKFAPGGRGGVISPGISSTLQIQDFSACPISQPNTTYCGDFKKWYGEDRIIDVVVE